MSGFVKVYGSILDSSIWSEDPHTRIVWIALLVMADATGFVEASVSGIARRANVSAEQCRAALACFEAPDPDSKDPAHEGRRVERVVGGFQVLNYLKYRERQTEAQQQAAERQRRWRERQAESNGSAGVIRNASNATATPVTLKAEAEADQILEESWELRGDAARGAAPNLATKKRQAPGRDAATFVEDWNATCTNLPGVKDLSDKRRRLITAIQAQHDRETCRAVMGFINADAFYNGEKPSQDHPNWQADIDYVLRPGVFTKLLEKAQHRKTRPAPAQKFDAHLLPPPPGARREDRGTHIVEFSRAGEMRILPNAAKMQQYRDIDKMLREKSGLPPISERKTG